MHFKISLLSGGLRDGLNIMSVGKYFEVFLSSSTTYAGNILNVNFKSYNATQIFFLIVNLYSWRGILSLKEFLLSYRESLLSLYYLCSHSAWLIWNTQKILLSFLKLQNMCPPLNYCKAYSSFFTQHLGNGAVGV